MNKQHRRNQWISLLLVCLMLLTMIPAALAEETATAAPEATETVETADVASQSPTDVLATVNGQAITRGEVEGIAINFLAEASQYGYDTSDAAFEAQVNSVAMSVAIQMALMQQKAVEWGLDQLTDEELTEIETQADAEYAAALEYFLNSYMAVAEDASEEQKNDATEHAKQLMTDLGYTKEAMMETYKQNAIMNKVNDRMIAGAEATDDEVRALYETKVKSDEEAYKDNVAMYEYMTQYYGQPSYYTPEGFRGITHILLIPEQELLDTYHDLQAKLEEQDEEEEKAEDATTEDAEPAEGEASDVAEEVVTQEMVDAARQAILDSVQATIDEINEKLAAGETFASLVEAYGQDPGMQQEPNKTNGYSVHMDSILWDPVFTAAAFSVDHVGDIAAPVVGNYGVHIVQYTRDVPSGAVELTDEMFATLKEETLSQKESELAQSTLQTWLDEAVISYTALGEPFQMSEEE